MSNTDLLYSYAKKYQDKRADIMNAFEKREAQLQSAKGSRFYDEEMKKALSTRNTALNALQIEYRDHFNSILQSMMKMNGKREMKPPTDEELRLLQVLKMKESLSESDFEAAANTLKGNTTCLEILTDMARAQGNLRNYLTYSGSNEMPVASVNKALKGIASTLEDFMNYDTRKAARIAKQSHDEVYGVNEYTVPKRELFNDKAGCFKDLFGLSGDEMGAFCKAVDGE